MNTAYIKAKSNNDETELRGNISVKSNIIGASFIIGPKGDTGKSAYQYWLEQGNFGSEEDFLASLKGDKGDTGKDGYTPIKGIDYFDGKNGISATHSWNGTTLTITSASGSSSANLKGEQGIKGERGERGLQGFSGVYVGSGEMPDGYNVQIIVDGEASTGFLTAEEVQAMINASLGVIENGYY